MIGRLTTTIAHGFCRTALPLGAYYGVTLAIPIANGAAQSGAIFVEHALIVLVVPPVAIVLACTVHAIGHVLLEHEARRCADVSCLESCDVRHRTHVTANKERSRKAA